MVGAAQRRTTLSEDVDVLQEPELMRARAVLRFPIGWAAALAAVAGAIVATIVRADPFANPDSLAFQAIARSLLEGHGYVYREPMFPSLPLYAFRSAGYSTFLALFLSFGVPIVVAVQGALHGVAAALLGGIARRLAGERAAWVAFALAILWPSSWLYATQLLSESFLAFALIFAVWLAMEAADRRSLAWAVTAGVVATIAMFTRPTAMGPIVVLVTWLTRRFPRGALAMVLAAVIAWAPWPIRNYARLKAFVPFQTMGGVALYDSHSGQPPRVAWEFMAKHPEMGELGLERHFMSETGRILRDDPGGFMARMDRAAIEYAGPILDRRPEMWLHRFALLALLPAVFWPGWRRRLALPGAMWLAFGLLVIPIVVNVRYRFPLEWCVVLGAATGLVAAWEHWGARRTAALAAGALAAAIAFTVIVGRG